MNKSTKLSFTVAEAAEATSLARSRLYLAMSGGSLKTFLAGRRRMISRKSLEEYVANLERESMKAGRR